MGFADQLRAVLGSMSESRQTLLFSATVPKALAEFARAGLRDPELVRLDTDSKLSPDLSLAFFTVRCDPGSLESRARRWAAHRRGRCVGAHESACGLPSEGLKSR